MIASNDARLLAIIDEIMPCEVLADIGSDHGYVPVIAFMKGLCSRAIACDISEESLNKAKALINSVEFANVETRCGDGLKVLNIQDYDTVVIAGMGGLEMIKILSQSQAKFNRYIMSPQRHQYEFRKFLSSNNIKPIKDYKVLSKGKFYDIIVAVQGEYTPSESELWYGSMQGGSFEQFKKLEIANLTKYCSASKGQQKSFHEAKLRYLGVESES